jgi:class 3 adenylate cyclase
MVTALFVDIIDSTELGQNLDPEEARAIIDPALGLMIDAVRRFDGYVVQSTGDGIFALFGAPVAREDHPQRSLYSAMRMQDEIRRYSARLRADGRAPIQIRAGANSGEVVVRTIKTGAGHTEYTPIGHTVNLASRLQNLASAGSTVISDSRLLNCAFLSFFARSPIRSNRVNTACRVRARTAFPGADFSLASPRPSTESAGVTTAFPGFIGTMGSSDRSVVCGRLGIAFHPLACGARHADPAPTPSSPDSRAADPAYVPNSSTPDG